MLHTNLEYYIQELLDTHRKKKSTISKMYVQQNSSRILFYRTTCVSTDGLVGGAVEGVCGEGEDSGGHVGM